MQDLPRVSAPGRICLFGEHQDYLGLPVVAATVNLRILVNATPRSDRRILVRMPDIYAEEEIDPGVEQVYRGERDYLRSAFDVLRRMGLSWSHGFDAEIRSGIPINAGVSSSSALTVMWIKFLAGAADNPPAFSAEDLARLGSQAEVVEFGEPGGMMDHYCAALGGLLWIDTRPPFQVKRLAANLDGFVIGNSLEPKATLETLAQNRSEVSEGVARLKHVMPAFDLATTPLADVEGLFKYLQPASAKRVRANLVNRNITVEAQRAIADDDTVKLGHLLTLHHAQLRDGLDLSTPKIERMLEAAREAGALGGKINGSGGGGTMFAYAPGRQEAVAAAIEREGGVPHIVTIDEGARIDS
jgi:galactokinase